MTGAAQPADLTQPPATQIPIQPVRELMPPTVPWATFRQSFDWRQGEHVTLVGPTGAGKTTLLRALLPLRSHVLFLATKKRDDSIDAIAKDGYRRMRKPQDWANRIIVEPPFPADAAKMLEAHRETFRHAMMKTAYQAGNWCVVADEVRYICKDLGLEREAQILWLQGRSLGISFVAATQRPRHIPLEAYDQATHLFLWRDSDAGNVKRLAEIGGGVNIGLVQRAVPRLSRHDFLYVNTRTGDTIISNAKEGLHGN